MLDPRERYVFDGMVSQLRADDPGFGKRVDRLSRPRPPLRVAAAVLLWMIAPACLLIGGWIGAVLTVAVAGLGARLFVRRHRAAPQPLWWTASRGRRPGASI